MSQIVPRSVASHLLSEILGRPQAHAALGELCDAVGCRSSGAESGDRAEAWAQALFEGWGLDVNLEPIEVQVWTRGNLVLRVLEPSAWTMTALAHGFAPQRAELKAPVIDLGHGEAADYEQTGVEVAGALVLCDEGAAAGQRVLHRTEKLRLAAAHGAAGLMILSSADGSLPRTGTCHVGEAPIPSLGISQEDGLRLRRILAAGGKPIAELSMRNEIGEGRAHNVIADLPGRPESGGGSEASREIVLAGAHLDSWDVAQGATDNGLGSAIVLEAARALASLPEALRPRRRLRFALWAAEEIGLLGSKHYVERRSAALDRYAAIMNFDMTGDPYGYWTPGRPEPHPMLEALSDQLAPLGMSRSFAHKAGLHSDHQAFMLAGIPVVGLLAILDPLGRRYYHSVGDTFEKVRLPDFCRAACVAAHTLWALADAEPRPFARLNEDEVRSMIETSGLAEALAVDGTQMPTGRVTG